MVSATKKLRDMSIAGYVTLDKFSCKELDQTLPSVTQPLSFATAGYTGKVLGGQIIKIDSHGHCLIVIFKLAGHGHCSCQPKKVVAGY